MKRSSFDTMVTIAIGIAAVVSLGTTISDRMRLHRLPRSQAARHVSAENGQPRVAPAIALRWATMGNLIGRKDAPVRIVEFGSFTCGFCAALHRAFAQIRTKYPDIISIRWINAVPRTGTAQSKAVAVAGECADRQGQFEAFHDNALTPGVHLGTAAEFIKIAEQIHVRSIDSFTACLQATDVADKIDAEAEEAINERIDGTPTWFVNGRPVGGAMSADSVEAVILEELRRVRGH